MKIYFKSSNRIKGKVPPDRILPSNTRTFDYPDDAATVVLSNVAQQKPNFKIYFNGFKDSQYGSNGARSLYVVAEQIFRNGKYHTYFGLNSWIPTENLEDMNTHIGEIEQIING